MVTLVGAKRKLLSNMMFMDPVKNVYHARNWIQFSVEAVGLILSIDILPGMLMKRKNPLKSSIRADNFLEIKISYIETLFYSFGFVNVILNASVRKLKCSIALFGSHQIHVKMIEVSKSKLLRLLSSEMVSKKS